MFTYQTPTYQVLVGHEKRALGPRLLVTCTATGPVFPSVTSPLESVALHGGSIRWSLAGELSTSHTLDLQLMGLSLVNHPLQVSQPGCDGLGTFAKFRWQNVFQLNNFSLITTKVIQKYSTKSQNMSDECSQNRIIKCHIRNDSTQEMLLSTVAEGAVTFRVICWRYD